MTQKEVIAACIVAYERAIKEVEPMDEVTRQLIINSLIRKNLHKGVCYYINNTDELCEVYRPHGVYNYLGKPIWISKNTDYGGWWHRTPEECWTKKDILESLRHRLDVLQKEYSNIQ